MTACVSSAFVLLVSVRSSIGIENFAVGLKICIILAEIKKYKLVIKK